MEGRDFDMIDDRPLCWSCGKPMELVDDFRTIEIDGMEWPDPLYQCVNPDCDSNDTEEE